MSTMSIIYISNIICTLVLSISGSENAVKEAISTIKYNQDAAAKKMKDFEEKKKKAQVPYGDTSIIDITACLLS
jgi:hypothetical protein